MSERLDKARKAFEKISHLFPTSTHGHAVLVLNDALVELEDAIRADEREVIARQFAQTNPAPISPPPAEGAADVQGSSNELRVADVAAPEPEPTPASADPIEDEPAPTPRRSSRKL